MSKGIVVKVTDLEKKRCRVQCFNKHTWNIRQGVAYRVVPTGNLGEEVELYEVPVSKIFNQIKFIWFRGDLVARWNGEVVVTMGDNKFVKIRSKNSDKIQSELNKQAFRDAVQYERRKKMLDQARKIYSKLDRQEFQCWVFGIRDFWYTKKDT
ncbi:hypothetical protein [Enterococcus sp. AZ163]|uniref:hypothetical protein n=1 Tax=Enterococcus sp. AZ163 TaxID=2774638 RepID=UPI003D26A156